MRKNEVIANQEKILANQEQIKQNQDKLDLVLASQETILANQEQIKQKGDGAPPHTGILHRVPGLLRTNTGIVARTATVASPSRRLIRASAAGHAR